MVEDVVIRDAGPKGKGVFALRDFVAGEFIFRRRNGPPLTERDVAALPSEHRVHVTELGAGRFAVVLPPGCFLNHSCAPNALRRGVNVVAWTDIREGDEITLDYRLYATGDEGWSCVCRSANCVGCVAPGGFFGMDEEWQRLHLPYAARFVRAEYRRRRRSR